MVPPTVPDVLIAGAGPAGASLALLLGRRGLRVVLVTGGGVGPWQLGEHLSPLGCHALMRIDPALLTGHLTCSGIDAAWGGSELQHTDYAVESNGFGLLLDRRALDTAAIARLASCNNVTVVNGRLVSLKRTRGCWTAQVRAAQAVSTLRARFVVDATGRRSVLARALGARRHRLDRLVAAVASFDLGDAAAAAPDEHARLLLEGAADGWWYTALLRGNRRIVAFLTDADLLGGADPQRWSRRLRLTEYVRRTLSPRARPARLVGRPADSSILSHVNGPGWAAVGEAALALDPVSGSGLRCVFDDAIATADVVTEALDGSGDALAARQGTLVEFFRRYLLGRQEIYGREMRWPDQLFWRRRHEASDQRPV